MLVQQHRIEYFEIMWIDTDFSYLKSSDIIKIKNILNVIPKHLFNRTITKY